MPKCDLSSILWERVTCALLRELFTPKFKLMHFNELIHSDKCQFFCPAVYVTVLRSLFKLFFLEEQTIRNTGSGSPSPLQLKFEDGLHEYSPFCHMSYTWVYVIKSNLCGRCPAIHLYVRLEWQKNYTSDKTRKLFSTESSGRFMKERVNDEIYTGFMYCGF